MNDRHKEFYTFINSSKNWYNFYNYVNSEKPIDWVEALTALLDVPDNLIFADQKVLIKRYNIKNIAHEYAKLYAESSGW